MAMKTVQDLLLNELRDIYDAEKQLVRALPKMAKASSSEQLRLAFQEHLEETKHQVERLEQVFDRLGARPAASVAKRCVGSPKRRARSWKRSRRHRSWTPL